jgi:hypothetical protein
VQTFPGCSLIKADSWRQQGSQQNLDKKEKARYALFRIEVSEASSFLSEHGVREGRIRAVWATASALEYLDPKDALYREMQASGVHSSMPATALIPWDCDRLDGVPELPAHKCLLKASLGSGGYGLYIFRREQGRRISCSKKSRRQGAISSWLRT